MKRGPVRIAELLARFIEDASGRAHLHRRGPGPRTFEVFRAFERIGPPMTSHAEAVAFRRGRLQLRVRSSAWMTELGMMQGELLQRINASLPKPWVEELRLVLGDPGPRPRRLSTLPPRLHPSDGEKVTRWALSLEDSDVRAAFERAATSALAHRPRVRGGSPFRGPPGPRVMPSTPWESDESPEPELTYGYGNRDFDRWQAKQAGGNDTGDEDTPPEIDRWKSSWRRADPWKD